MRRLLCRFRRPLCLDRLLRSPREAESRAPGYPRASANRDMTSRRPSRLPSSACHPSHPIPSHAVSHRDLVILTLLSAHVFCQRRLGGGVRSCRPVAAPVAAQAPLGLPERLVPVMAAAVPPSEAGVLTRRAPGPPPTWLFIPCNYCNQSAHI